MDEKYDYSVLFVEDEDEIRENYTKYLKKYFNRVYEANDGEMGYNLYFEKMPDIVVTDINLPILTGLELAQRIRQEDYRTKIIILSAFSDVEYLLEASALKLVKYLVKPISRTELKEALELALEEFKTFEVIHKSLLNLQDDFSWNYDTKTLYKGEDIVYLTANETIIVSLLLSRPDTLFTYDDIIFEVWGNCIEDKVSALKTTIKNIRKKLPEGSIENVFAKGYKIC